MVGNTNPDDEEGQKTISLGDMPYFPATVTGHTGYPDGLRLHTLDGDPQSDLFLFDDGRPAERVVNVKSD